MLTALIILLGIQVFMSIVLLSTQRNYRQLARLMRERELDQRYQAQQLLAACHEIRSPVTAIQAALDLKTSWADPAEATCQPSLASSDIELFARNIARIDSLVDEVLDLTQDPTLPDSPSVVDLFEIVGEEVVRHPRARLSQKPTSGSFRVETDDSRRLGWAISNLLTNASEHCRRIIEVRVFHAKLSDGRSAVAVRIADDGAGLGSSDPRSAARNSGFGLRIVQSVVDSHLGELAIEPRAELGGAAFTLILPKAIGNSPTAITDSSSSIATS